MTPNVMQVACHRYSLAADFCSKKLADTGINDATKRRKLNAALFEASLRGLGVVHGGHCRVHVTATNPPQGQQEAVLKATAVRSPLRRR